MHRAVLGLLRHLALVGRPQMNHLVWKWAMLLIAPTSSGRLRPWRPAITACHSCQRGMTGGGHLRTAGCALGHANPGWTWGPARYDSLPLDAAGFRTMSSIALVMAPPMPYLDLSVAATEPLNLWIPSLSPRLHYLLPEWPVPPTCFRGGGIPLTPCHQLASHHVCSLTSYTSMQSSPEWHPAFMHTCAAIRYAI